MNKYSTWSVLFCVTITDFHLKQKTTLNNYIVGTTYKLKPVEAMVWWHINKYFRGQSKPFNSWDRIPRQRFEECLNQDVFLRTRTPVQKLTQLWRTKIIRMESTEGIPPLSFIKEWVVATICVLWVRYKAIFALAFYCLVHKFGIVRVYAVIGEFILRPTNCSAM